MSSIETARVDTLAGALFDTMVVPLAATRRAAGHSYFATAGDAGASSYFGPPSLAVMRDRDFDFPGGGSAEGLITAAAGYWAAQGEDGLAALAPRMIEIAAALREEAATGDGSVDILCYTMF